MLGTTRHARAGRRRAGRSSAFLSSFLSHRARWLLLHLDLDVGSRRTNAVSDNGSLGRLRPSERRMWRRARTGHFSINERPAAVSAGVVEREELAVDVEEGNLLALYLDQTRLTGQISVVLAGRETNIVRSPSFQSSPFHLGRTSARL